MGSGSLGAVETGKSFAAEDNGAVVPAKGSFHSITTQVSPATVMPPMHATLANFLQNHARKTSVA
jgi:hypothetical protein